MDRFSTGRRWMEAATGRLIKSELGVEQPTLGGLVTTTYRFDERFGINVPFEMREDYHLENGARVTALATYDNFRRFGVSAEETINK